MKEPGEFLPQKQIEHFEYQKTFIAMVISDDLNPGYFHLERADQLPEVILSNTDPLITEVVQQNKGGSQKIYKVQSKQRLRKEEISQIFVNGRVLFEQEWDAYPKFRKLEQNESVPNFRVGEGIYYVNSFELLGSCMETEIISAYNIINLILKHEAKQKNWTVNQEYLQNKRTLFEEL